MTAAVNVTVTTVVCTNLAGPCIDIYNQGGGTLFTNSPSVAYVDSIGGSQTNSTYPENGMFGPAGNFYTFDWYNAKRLCDTYNTVKLAGRTNWVLPTRNQLLFGLWDVLGPMYAARGWPTSGSYWSATPDGSGQGFLNMNLASGAVTGGLVLTDRYVSCTSFSPGIIP